MPEEIRTAQVWEDGLRTDPEKKSFEWWYSDTQFSDGSTLVITFFTKSPSNAGGPPAPFIQVVLNKPDGEKLSFSKDFSSKEFSASKDKCDVKIGNNKFTGNLKNYEIKVDFPEIKIDLNLERIAPSFSSSLKKVSSKPEYFGWFCAVPYGKVKAKISYSGEEKQLEGFGYHDHNWGIINLKNLCDYWYWGRGVAGDYYLIYSIIYLPKILGGKQASVLYLAKGDKILIEDSNNLKLLKTNINPPAPKVGHLPKELTFGLENADYNVEINLSEPKLIEKVDPIGSEPLLQKIITKLFSKPLYVRYNADLDLSIEHKNKKENIKGKGLYEIMILH